MDLAGRLPPDSPAGRRRGGHGGQVRDLVARLGGTSAVPLFVFDGGYHPMALADELAGDTAQILVRIKGDRVFYAGPPGRVPGGRGRPRRTAPGSAASSPPPGVSRRPR